MDTREDAEKEVSAYSIYATLIYDAENCLPAISGATSASFIYDGDGARLAREDPSGLTVNVGAVEVKINGTQRLTTTYYFAGGQRIAMRKDGEITYLHGDHLGSASLATDASGAKVSEMRYTPFGEIRYGDAPTDRRFTGQREEAGIGLYDYGARFYSASVGRFVSADVIVPGGGSSQTFNRYTYVLNNPLKYIDPSGYQGQSWEDQFKNEHGRAPSEQDRWDYEFCQQVYDFAGWEATYIMRQVLYAAGATFQSSSSRRWMMADITAIFSAMESMINALGGINIFRNTVGNSVVFERIGSASLPKDFNTKDPNKLSYIPNANLRERIFVYDTAIWDNAKGEWIASGTTVVVPDLIIHELAHRWGYNQGDQSLEKDFEKATGGKTNLFGKYTPGGTPPTTYATTSRVEDFAESMKFYVLGLPLDALRTAHMGRLFSSPPIKKK